MWKYISNSTCDLLKYGDVIIANVGATLGTVFRAPDFKIPMTLAPNTILLKPKIYFVDNKFIKYYFFSPKGQKQIENIATGSAQPKFNNKVQEAIALSLIQG